MVRGGHCRVDTLLRSALTLYSTQGQPGVSIFAAALGDAELVRAAGGALPHDTVRFGWVDDLVAAGFDVVPTGRPPHHTVWLSDVREATLHTFADCFEAAVPRPVRR